MNDLKTIRLSALALALFLPTALMASSHGKTPDLTEEEHKSPTVPQKVGRESARVIGQVEEAGKSLGDAFTHQRHKDKKAQKDKKK